MLKSIMFICIIRLIHKLEVQFDTSKLRSLAKALLKKGIPPVKGLRDKELCHVVFVPEVTHGAPGEIDGVHVVTGDQVLSVKP
jgi:hypothetical protein